MVTSKPPVEYLLQEAEQEAVKYEWAGTFADYLHAAIENPGMARLSHKLVYDAIVSEGVGESQVTGQPVYDLFKGSIFGLDDVLEKIVQFFASSSRNLETRKRMLLLLGPHASGKSSIAALLKRALERYTRGDAGALYTIKGCPMQEEPLHLIPHKMRPKVKEEYGLYIEGDLCPKCRYLLSNQYQGKISEMPIVRVTFSDKEAIGAGYYNAASPDWADISLLTGKVDTTLLSGERIEVSSKAVRMDGQMNTSNRGIVELDNVFKIDSQHWPTLLALIENQTIKMEQFGSIYGDEVVIGYSTEEDYKAFLSDERSEVLRSRVFAIQVPYNLRVSDEERIYQKVLRTSGLSVHIPPQTLPMIGMLGVLTRLEQPNKKGAALADKLWAYDGQKVDNFSQRNVEDEGFNHPYEGMSGLSPRYIVNRFIGVASEPDACCVSPLKALDSVWKGLNWNDDLDKAQSEWHIGLIKNTVDEYNRRAIETVQKAYVDNYEQTASDMTIKYLSEVAEFVIGQSSPDNEVSMREMEKAAKVSEKEKVQFRRDIHIYFEDLKRDGKPVHYTSEPRIKDAIEERLLPNHKTLKSELSDPKSEEKGAEWRKRRGAIHHRLVSYYGYCPQCAEDVVEYALHLLKTKQNWQGTLKVNKNNIEWLWELEPRIDTRPSEE